MITDTQDQVEMSKQGYFTILLDENLHGLERSLEDDGFKVVTYQQGTSDEALKRKARGWAILTRNSKDFIDDAVRYDYDVIGIEGVNFIDTKHDRTNDTVRKISGAVRRSGIATRKGNFHLIVNDSGTYVLRQLV